MISKQQLMDYVLSNQFVQLKYSLQLISAPAPVDITIHNIINGSHARIVLKILQSDDSFGPIR